jgi:hypothetical protein
MPLPNAIKKQCHLPPPFSFQSQRKDHLPYSRYKKKEEPKFHGPDQKRTPTSGKSINDEALEMGGNDEGGRRLPSTLENAAVHNPCRLKRSYKETDALVYIFYTGSPVAATGVELVTSLSFSAVGESSVPPVSTLVADFGSSELGIGFSAVVPIEGRLAPLFIRLLV